MSANAVEDRRRSGRNESSIRGKGWGGVGIGEPSFKCTTLGAKLLQHCACTLCVMFAGKAATRVGQPDERTNIDYSTILKAPSGYLMVYRTWKYINHECILFFIWIGPIFPVTCPMGFEFVLLDNILVGQHPQTNIGIIIFRKISYFS